jgi:hypothetical protein
MQDRDSIQHDDGKFALPFTVNPSKEQNSSKELSILESMVDENYLNASEVVAVKTMDSVDKFYNVLLKDLMKNFNTLKDKNLDSSVSILANLKYMADELREKGISKTLPDSVNACNGNVVCIDAIIDNVFKDLEISDSEAIKIKIEHENPSEELNVESTTLDIIGTWKVSDPEVDITEWNPTVFIKNDMSCTYEHLEGYTGTCTVLLEGTYFSFIVDDAEFAGKVDGTTSYFCIDGKYSDGSLGTNCWRKKY